MNVAIYSYRIATFLSKLAIDYVRSYVYGIFMFTLTLFVLE